MALRTQLTERREREFAAASNQQVGCGFITWAPARQPEALDPALCLNTGERPSY